VALATEPLFPLALTRWVDQGQEAVTRAAYPNGLGPTASMEAKKKWTAPASLITVRDVAPKAPSGCDMPDCPPSPLLSKSNGELKVSLQITPLAVAPDTDYAVVLSARNGHVYDSVNISWTREDLVGIDPAERSVIIRKETEAHHNRWVDPNAPYDDVSIPLFVEDYNGVIGAASKAYEAAKAKEAAVDPIAAPIISALFPGALEPLDDKAPQFDYTEVDSIVKQHYNLELVKADIFSAWLLANQPGRSSSGKSKP